MAGKPRRYPVVNGQSIYSNIEIFGCGVGKYKVGGGMCFGSLDIRWGGTNSYFKYEFVLHTPAGLAWLSRTNKGDMVLTDSK